MKKLMYALMIILVLLGGSGCSAEQASPNPVEITQELRISNLGSEDIQDLVVVFPGDTATSTVRVAFGDVAAGEITEYQSVPGGVYRYAAYEYALAERTIMQPVTDWVGERPIQGTQFTYEIMFDSAQVQGRQVHLFQVISEEQ